MEFERLQNIDNLIRLTSDETERNMLLDMKYHMKVSLIKEVHKYKVTHLEKCDRWNTYVKTDAGRKEIKAKTEQELYLKLWEWYGFTGITLYSLFFEWFSYKRDLTSSENTMDRYEQYFHKYLENSPLIHKTIQKITDLELEKECNRLVSSFSLSYKAWQNLKTVLGGMYTYAVRKHYITTDLMKDVKIKVRYRQVCKKDASTEIYTDSEFRTQRRYLYYRFWEKRDPVFAAILFQSCTGLRVGELAALRWSDIRGKRIHVHSEEVYDRHIGETKRMYHIVPHTKTYTDREFYLSKEARAVLGYLDHSTEFVFSRPLTGRVTSRQITYQLEHYAVKYGLTVKRSHKLRKTFATRLAAQGVELETIRKILGHQDLKTTLGYIFESKDDRSESLIDLATAS